MLILVVGPREVARWPQVSLVENENTNQTLTSLQCSTLQLVLALGFLNEQLLRDAKVHGEQEGVR